MNDDFAERLAAAMAHYVEMIPSYVDLIFIAKLLKRVGDQATGEDVVYAINAQEMRHMNVPHFDLQEDGRWIPGAYQSGHFAAMSSLLRSVQAAARRAGLATSPNSCKCSQDSIRR